MRMPVTTLTAVYSDEQRRLIRAALPKKCANADKAVEEIERVARGYQVLKEGIERRMPKATEQAKAWRKVERLSLDLEWPIEQAQALKQATKQALAICGFTTASFRNKHNPARDFLYGQLMDVWRHHHGRLSKSLSRSSDPKLSPAVRFLMAALNPVLGSRLSPSGVASIIRREQERLKWVREEAERIVREGRGKWVDNDRVRVFPKKGQRGLRPSKKVSP